MITNADLLREVPFFQILDERERFALSSFLGEVRVPKGEFVFQYGEPGDSLYIVRTGQVEVFVKDDTGQKMLLGKPTTGDYFGELSLLDGGPRTASVFVTEDLEALQLNRDGLQDFLKRHPEAGLDMLTVMGKRLRKNMDLLRHTASRNVNAETKENRTGLQKVADWIAEFSGSMPFLIMNTLYFFFWILLNIGIIPGLKSFDPFPFGLLTMIVSLEAIFLSCFVLISQNRQAAKDRVRSDIEYEVNLKAELEIAHLHEKIDTMNAKILERLSALSKV